MFHKRTKHIDIRYHWIRDVIEDGMLELNKVHTDDNASDMFTKAVAREKLKLSDTERKVLTVGILILRPGIDLKRFIWQESKENEDEHRLTCAWPSLGECKRCHRTEPPLDESHFSYIYARYEAQD
ncbi:retrovirus-related pol polyprotein from transposon TNT 1-94 [Tanacetum coccineum]